MFFEKRKSEQKIEYSNENWKGLALEIWKMVDAFVPFLVIWKWDCFVRCGPSEILSVISFSMSVFLIPIKFTVKRRPLGYIPRLAFLHFVRFVCSVRLSHTHKHFSFGNQFEYAIVTRCFWKKSRSVDITIVKCEYWTMSRHRWIWKIEANCVHASMNLKWKMCIM